MNEVAGVQVGHDGYGGHGGHAELTGLITKISQAVWSWSCLQWFMPAVQTNDHLSFPFSI